MSLGCLSIVSGIAVGKLQALLDIVEPHLKFCEPAARVRLAVNKYRNLTTLLYQFGIDVDDPALDLAHLSPDDTKVFEN